MSRVKRPAEGPDATITFTYESAYNQLVQPASYVSLSQYFVSHWLPGISAAGLKILLRLRAMGYYDPKKGVQRGDIDIDQQELAGLCGLSRSTLKRAFADDPILSDYVQRVFRVERDPRNGRIVREHYLYVVKMDDVLTPADRARLEQMLQGGNKPMGQNDPSEGDPMAQNEPSGAQSELPMAHSGLGSVQSDPPLNRSLHTPNTMNTSHTPAAAPEVLAPPSLPEKGVPDKPHWGGLSDAERAPWLDKAERELRENFGAAVWAKTKEKGRAAIRERRAVSLYLAGQKQVSQTSSAERDT